MKKISFEDFIKAVGKTLDEVIAEKEKEEKSKPKYVGYFGIKYIVVNDAKKKVSIHWKDGEITSAKCNEEDVFDKYTGFALAFTKKAFVSNNALKDFVDKFGFKPEPIKDKKK